MIGIDNKEFILDFSNYLKLDKNYSDNTVESYLRDIRYFLDYVNKEIIDINKNDIDDYITFNLNNYNESSLNRMIASIKGFFKYLSIEEVDKLLDINLNNAFDYRNKAILEMMYATGLRASEVVNLEIQNIDLVNKVVNVYGKGKKERIVPLSNISINYLDIYINNYRSKLFVNGNNPKDILFLNNHGLKMTRQGLYKIIGKIAKEKNINKEITPHVLRHSFATHMIECGADIRSVQELLGHENVITTEVYTHLADNFIKNSYNEYFNRSEKEVNAHV